MAIALAGRDAKLKKVRYAYVLCPTGIFDRLSAPFQINRRIQIQTVTNTVLTSSLKRWRAVCAKPKPANAKILTGFLNFSARLYNLS